MREEEVKGDGGQKGWVRNTAVATTTMSSWAHGGGGWSGNRNPTLSINNDKDESIVREGVRI